MDATTWTALIQAIGGGLQGAAAFMPQDSQMRGVNRRALGPIGGLGIEDLFRRGLGNIEHLGGVATARAAQPVTLPSSYVQPLPQYLGPHVSVAVPGLDPALVRPSLQGLPGIRFGEPQTPKQARDFPQGTDMDPAANRGAEQWMFPGAPRRRNVASEVDAYKAGGEPLPEQQGLRQWPPGMPGEELGKGGGFGELGAALELLGVESDPNGRLTMGRNLPLFTGAAGPVGPRNEPPATTPDVQAPDTGGITGDDKSGNPYDPTYWVDERTGELDPSYFDEQPTYDEHGNLIEDPDRPIGNRGRTIG